jgi:hypothetical protein
MAWGERHGRNMGTAWHLLISLQAPTKMEKTECSEMSTYKLHTPENHPED